MNIFKLIAKFVLAFFIFSSIPVQSPIFAGGNETEGPIVEASGQNNQQYEQYRQLRKRAKWKNMFLSIGYFALSATFLSIDKSGSSVYGGITGAIGAFFMYDFLKAKIWGR